MEELDVLDNLNLDTEEKEKEKDPIDEIPEGNEPASQEDIKKVLHEITDPLKKKEKTSFDDLDLIVRRLQFDISQKLKPGIDICDIRKQLEKNIKEFGELMFPVSVELNNHINNFVPYFKFQVKPEDSFGITFGIEKNTYCYVKTFQCLFDDVYLDYQNYTTEALEAGIKACGVDVSVGTVSAAINEVLEAYDDYISPIRNVSGYLINDPRIPIPNVLIDSDEKPVVYSRKLGLDEEYVLSVFTANCVEPSLKAKPYISDTMFYRTEQKVDLGNDKKSKILLNYVTKKYGIGKFFALADIIEEEVYSKYHFRTLIKKGLLAPVAGTYLPNNKLKVFRDSKSIHIR